MAFLWKSYTRVLHKHTLLVGATTSGLLSGSGDVIAQLAIEKKGNRFDVYRNLRFLSFGFLIVGPALRGWYVLLDRVYKGTKTRTVLLKLTTDQLIFPPTIITTFMFYMSFTRRETIAKAKERYSRDFIPILCSNYKFWPLVQTVNFFMIPLTHRILFVNCASLLWNTYLAWRSEIP